MSMIIQWHVCVENITECEEKDCYAVSIEDISFTAYSVSMAGLTSCQLKNKLPEEVTVYDAKMVIQQLTAVVNIYLNL